MKTVGCLLSFLLLFVVCATAQQGAPGLKRVIVIRHAEKPQNGDNLSCKGLNRALELTDLLKKKIDIPDYIFVPTINTGKNTSTARMYQTIVPFAVKYNLTVNTKYNVDDTKDLAKDVLKRNGTVLLVWEHDRIDNIVKALGVQNVPKWPGNDFDSIWIIDFENGKATMRKDREGINPAADCK